MRSHKTTGIVLRRANFGEADRIITFLTPDRGKVKAVAKGVRRIKSRMAGHLELFNIVEIMLAQTRNLDIITSARLQASADPILDDYSRVSFGYLMAEMTDRLLEDEQAQPAVYDRLAEGLEQLAGHGTSALLELYFKLGLVDALGYRPHLASCAICHNKSDDYFFSPPAGGLVDSNCSTERNLPMTSHQIKLWRLILSQPLDQLRRISGGEEVAASTLAHCNEFYDYTFGKRFKSQQFLAGRP